MIRSKRLSVVALVIALSAFTSVVAAKPARLITIDYPGAVSTLAYGTNPAGDIVGGYYDSLGHEHGFVLRAGRFTAFDWRGSTWTEGWGINPQGDIVGQYGWFESGFNTFHGFLRETATSTPSMCRASRIPCSSKSAPKEPLWAATTSPRLPAPPF